METNPKNAKRIDQQKLTGFVSQVFERLGVPENEAEIAANVLVMADLRGVDTHGVIRLKRNTWYVKWLQERTMNPTPKLRVIRENPSTALVDGDAGMGMVIGHRAMELAIEKARGAGVGMVGVCNSRHFGMSAYYAMMALPHDMIGIAMTNASRQVVPTFGRVAKYGTNPICFAVPAEEEPPFVLDMATTTAAAGKLEVAARHGDSIPLGWALNESAEPTADPRVAQKARRLLPLGGTREGGSHKGYGLGVVVEVLCGVLTGTITALNPNQEPRGHFFGAICIDAFRPVAAFKRDMDRLLRELKLTMPIEGQERVVVAGEIELETADQRSRQGIPLHSSVLEGLRELSRELSILYDLE